MLGCLTLLMFACGGVRPGATGKHSKLYTAFYTGSESGTQYFIKPLQFSGEGQEALIIDVTFRDGNFTEDSATINYTLTTSTQLDKQEPITAVTPSGETVFTTKEVTRLFQEREKDNFRTRFSGLVSNGNMIRALQQKDIRFKRSKSGVTTIYSPSPRTINRLRELNEQLLSLYN